MLRITSNGSTTTVLEVAGEVDLSTAEQFAEAVDAAAGDASVERIIVDLGGVSFMDSAGLRVLVTGVKAAEARGAKLVATDAQPQVKKVFQLTGLDEILGLTDAGPGSAAQGD